MKKNSITIIMITILLLCCGCGAVNAAEEEADPIETVYYVTNDYYHMESEGSLHILSHFETFQQSTGYTCGAVAALMVLNYYGIQGYDEAKISVLAGTNSTQGTTVEGLINFFIEQGYDLYYHADTEPEFWSYQSCEEFIIEMIDSDIPILIQWEDWGGHWQVIIGIDSCDTADFHDDVLIMADPLDVTDHVQDGYYVVPFARFFFMWREGALNNKPDLYEQPYILVQRPE